MWKLAYICSLLVIFTIPWEDAFTIGAIGTVTRVIGLITAIIWFGIILVSGKLRKPQWFHYFLFLFVVWNLTSLFWSVSIDESTVQIKTLFQLGVMAYIYWDLYTTPKELNAAMQVYILGGYVAVISTVINYLAGQQISEYSGGRYAGAGVNAVDLALTLALGLPIAWHLAVQIESSAKNQFTKMLNFAYIPTALFAIVLTGSRTAIFVTLPTIIYLFVTFKRIKPLVRLSIFSFLLGSLLFLQHYIPQTAISRLATTASSIYSGDLGGRVQIWRDSLLIFQENPILGIGSGALSSPTALGGAAHNTYISILTELGVIGFIIFMTLLGVVVKRATVQEKQYAQLWITVLAIWAIGVLSLTWEYRKTTWLILSLVIIGAKLYKRQFRVAETTSSPVCN
jgi:O-antigen ligase